jgi:hypothetical protein
MKSYLLLTSLLLAGAQTHAYTLTAVCEEKPFTIEVQKIDAALPKYTLKKNGTEVANGRFTSAAEGYESDFVKMYHWDFRIADEGVFGLGVAGLQNPIAGTYEAFSDLYIELNGEIMDGASVPCTLTIK